MGKSLSTVLIGKTQIGKKISNTWLIENSLIILCPIYKSMIDVFLIGASWLSMYVLGKYFISKSPTGKASMEKLVDAKSLLKTSSESCKRKNNNCLFVNASHMPLYLGRSEPHSHFLFPVSSIPRSISRLPSLPSDELYDPFLRQSDLLSSSSSILRNKH